ncbi:transposable element Tcb2 transposase [Trichonephila clavipes]|nr:transposable element Tcb2 transposase [Trichonephila clavipes]
MLRSQRPLRQLSLIPQHPWNCMKWCRNRSSWLPSDWHRKVFSNESHFTLEADDHHFLLLYTALKAQQYVDTILRLVVLPFMTRHPGASFQQDNAKPNTTRISLDYLRALNTLPWPARSKYTFANQTILEHGRVPGSGIPKYRKSEATTGEYLAECIAGCH